MSKTYMQNLFNNDGVKQLNNILPITKYYINKIHVSEPN